MKPSTRLFSFLLSFGLTACGGGDSSIKPDVSDFTLDEDVQEDIDEAGADGAGAEGSFDYDEESGELTITFASSSFGCGIETGELVAKVITVSESSLVLSFDEEEDGTVTWTRVDEFDPTESNPLVGVWHTDEPDLYLLLSSQGSAQIIGEDTLCGDDTDRERNEENCLSLDVPGGANMTIDGDFDDWTAIRSGAILEDDSGETEREGADLRSLQVAFSEDTIYVRMELHGPPSEQFQGRQDPLGGEYRLTLRGDGGLSMSTRAVYSPESQTWGNVSQEDGVEVGVGSPGIEWSVDLGDYRGEGFENIDLIMVEAMDCGQGNCQSLDNMDCGWMEVPN